MRIVRSADWRDDLPWETPVLASTAAPGDPSRCAFCTDGALVPRTELWVVKHKHPNNPAGYVRLYCLDHRPAPKAEPVAPTRPAKRTRSAGTARTASGSPSRVARPEPKPAAVCPDCFIEVPMTGVCGMCGTKVS